VTVGAQLLHVFVSCCWEVVWWMKKGSPGKDPPSVLAVLALGLAQAVNVDVLNVIANHAD
jgi:hypothetical protein